MKLAPGERIGPYEIVDPIGAGGMGEVYRARDSSLQRLVALKVLPEPFAADPERLARFEREARTLALLNHPHIAQIYGLERRASQPDTAAVLVMEYVDGEDLTREIARGPIAVEVATRIGRQIAEALEAAHEQGIVHRDLKPANIKLRPDGTIKVLDFGLAKVLDSPLAPDTVATAPTLTAAGTQLGSLIGTAAYMAPEQARGRVVDKRADIWAFGVILFEMLTGARLFAGETTTEVLAAVLTHPVPWDSLPAATPRPLRELLRRCLEPDPRERLRDIGEARVALQRGSAAAQTEEDHRSPQRTPTRWWAPAAVAALSVAAAFAAGWLLRPQSPPAGQLRFDIEVPSSLALTRPGVNPVLTVAPEGRRIAFVADRKIWVWSAETGVAEPLEDTDGARAPFFSPSGGEIGFFTDQELRRIAVNGGPATTIVDAPGGGAGAWTAGGSILYHRWTGQESGLYRVSIEQRRAEVLAPAKQLSELRVAPSLLPDGEHYLFTTGGLRVAERQVCTGSIAAPETNCFARADSHVAYSRTGHVLFVRRGQLVALPFDVQRQRPAGEPVPVRASVRWFGPTGVSSFAVSADGSTLVYQQPGGRSRLVWVDRQTRATTPVGEPARFGSVRLSPDGRRVATEIWDDEKEGRDLYIVDLASGVANRVIAEDVDAIVGAWMSNERLVISRAVDSPPDILSLSLDNPGEAKTLLSADGVQLVRDATSDGRSIAYTNQHVDPSRREGVQVHLLSPDGRQHTFRDQTSNSFDPRFSPDGRWLAYAFVERNRPEIYVALADGSGVPRRLSRNGGVLPRWRADGRELYFVQADGMMVAVDPSLTLPVPTLLFAIEGAEPNLSDYRDSERWFDYDVTPDGQRFLIRQPTRDARSTGNLRVVIGWNSGLN